jgi:hypothetical protein
LPKILERGAADSVAGAAGSVSSAAGLVVDRAESVVILPLPVWQGSAALEVDLVDFRAEHLGHPTVAQDLALRWMQVRLE